MVERSDAVEQQAVRDGAAFYSVEPEIAATEDVPPGYKRTEVGVIPEDWSTETIFAVADYSKSRFDDGDWVEAEFLTTSGVRLLQTGNIGVGVFKEKESKKYISIQSFQQLRCKDVFPGDLLICRLADPAGRACIAPDLGSKRMITSVDVAIFRPSPELADPNFLLGVFCTPRWFSEVAGRCGGSTRTRISRSQLAKIPVQLPSIQEQRAIATALSDADALIESLDRLIAKKRAIKQAAMQELITGQTRLPGFTGEWETKRLGDVASFHKGSGLSKADLLADGTDPCIHYGELFTQYGEMIANVKSRTNRQSACFKSFKNDVLMPTSDVTPNGLATASCITKRDVILGGDILIIRPNEGEMDGTFLAYKIRMDHRQIMQLVSGTTVFHIYGRDMASFIYEAPTADEQRAIVSVLSDMDTEIEALERRRDKARQIKQGMMQQLLTGRVRLVEPKTTEPVA